MKPLNVSQKSATEGEIGIRGDIGPGGWFSEGYTAQDFADDLAALGPVTKITVGINSFGGDMFDGVSIYNQLMEHPAEIVVVVEGMAASAASIVAMAGSPVRMLLGSQMMVHNPMAIAMGNAEELRARADLLDRFRDGVLPIYAAKTGRTTEELVADLDAETWMDPDEAIAAGFADEVADDEIEVENAVDARAIMVGSVEFARERMPAAILALAVPPVATNAIIVDGPPVATNEIVIDDAAESDDEPSTLAELEILKAETIEAIRVAATLEERDRIRAIVDLMADAGPGHEQLAGIAMFGGETDDGQPLDVMDAGAVAVAIVSAGQAKRAQLLADRRADAPTLGDPNDKNTVAAADLPESDESRKSIMREQMVKGINSTR